MGKVKKILVAAGLLILFLFLIFLLVFIMNFSKSLKKQSQNSTLTTEKITTKQQSILYPPVSDAKSRITKKPFGIFVMPQNSPVQPEKFTGYHTGTDFETTPAEANQEIPVFAACSGNIRVKEFVSGYGGVIVQDCHIQNQTVTVLYGHIDITKSFAPAVGQNVAAGTKLAILAPARSHFTDGERKHLHLGIHKGSQIDFRGYVQNKAELSGWLNAANYL